MRRRKADVEVSHRRSRDSLVTGLTEGRRMSINFFRQRRAGPELAVEDAVAECIPGLFETEYPLWAGGSLPLGAGRPDLVVVSVEPKVYALAQIEISTAQILAYLRVVGRARPKTISERTGQSVDAVILGLEGLCEVEAVSVGSNVYTLTPDWKEILPEIVTIEVKVADWQKAASQAGRNRIFAHKSFVAFPELLATRTRKEPLWGKLGIGILGVAEDGGVRVVKQARRHQPRVWTYYYRLAEIVANHSKGVDNALRRSPAPSAGRLS